MMTSSQQVQSTQAFNSHLRYIQQQQIQQEQGSREGEGESTMSPPLNMQAAAAIFTVAAHNSGLHQAQAQQNREQVRKIVSIIHVS